MFRVQAFRVQCTSLPCSAYKPGLFIALCPHWDDILFSPFILSFYLKHTDNQLVKAGVTSLYLPFRRMFVPFHRKVWKRGRKEGWKDNEKMSLHTRNTHQQGVWTINERRKQETKTCHCTRYTGNQTRIIPDGRKSRITFWAATQTQRSYSLVCQLRCIFKSKTLAKIQAKVKLKEWYKVVSASGIKEIISAKDCINN